MNTTVTTETPEGKQANTMKTLGKLFFPGNVQMWDGKFLITAWHMDEVDIAELRRLGLEIVHIVPTLRGERHVRVAVKEVAN